VNKQEVHHIIDSSLGLCIYCGPSRNDVILSHRCAISKISILRSAVGTTTLLVYYTTTGCMFTALCGGVYVKRPRSTTLDFFRKPNQQPVVDRCSFVIQDRGPFGTLWMCLLSNPSRYLQSVRLYYYYSVGGGDDSIRMCDVHTWMKARGGAMSWHDVIRSYRRSIYHYGSTTLPG